MSTTLRVLRDYQIRINNDVNKFLADPFLVRGQIYSPTGSGKTECFSHTIHDLPSLLSTCNLPLKIAIIHPRIALSQEQLGRFKQSFGTRFSYTSFHSGAHVKGEEVIQEKNTTSPDDLERIMENSDGTHITFSSYDSFHKIAHIEFDLIVCDEAHNLTQDQYYGPLSRMKAKKVLFYTATPIIKGLAEDSSSMDNLNLFGDVICKVEPTELIRKGYIVPPLMHMLRVATDKKGTGVDTTEIVAQSFKFQHEQMSKYGMPFVQMLVASRGLEDHKKLESELTKLWELIGFIVPVYVIEASAHRKNNRKHLNSRYEMVQEIKNLGQNAIIMHYDTLSEGIDISSLTGACILRTMQKSKLLQTIGRCGRPYSLDLGPDGEVINMDKRLKPICVVTLPIVDGQHIGGMQAKSICDAFIAGGYGDLSTYMTDTDKKTMSEAKNTFDLGEDQDKNDIMSKIQDFNVVRDGQKIIELGFIF